MCLTVVLCTIMCPIILFKYFFLNNKTFLNIINIFLFLCFTNPPEEEAPNNLELPMSYWYMKMLTHLGFKIS